MSASHAPIYGIVAEFLASAEVVAAAQELRSAGLRRWDIFGPAPIEEVSASVPSRRGLYITAVMFAAGVAGACIGYFFQYWGAVLAYPINVGGRPDNGWPGFVPSAWEICAVFTVYFGFFAFWASCRLARLDHPIFAARHFERASQDRFFICVEAADERFDAERIRSLFRRHGALEVSEIAP